MMRMFCSVFVLFAVLSLDCAKAQAQPLGTQELLRQLGSEIYAEREAATCGLLRRESERKTIEKALQSDDAEVRKRVGQILAEFDRRKHERMVTAVRNAAVRCEPDRVVEMLTQAYGQPEDPRCWDSVIVLTQVLLDAESRNYGSVRVPKGFQRWSKSDVRFVLAKRNAIAAPRVTRELLGKRPNLPILIRGREIECPLEDVAGGIVCCDGPVQAKILEGTIVLANGDVTVCGCLFNSVVITDGSVNANGVTGSLVVARGDVKVALLTSSTVLCGSKAIIGKDVYASTVVGREVVHRASQTKMSSVNQNAPLPLVDFFGVSEVGAELAISDGALVVKRVDEGKCFERAGVRKGDIVLNLGDTKTEPAEKFRRLARKCLVGGEEFLLRVRRGAETLDIVIRAEESCKD
jgi:hypothetical protein